MADDDLCVSLLRQPDGHSEPDRVVVLRLPDEEAQRDLYSGIRKLLTEATLRPREPPRMSTTVRQLVTSSCRKCVLATLYIYILRPCAHSC
jgi:hypothetical protein